MQQEREGQREGERERQRERERERETKRKRERFNSSVYVSRERERVREGDNNEYAYGIEIHVHSYFGLLCFLCFVDDKLVFKPMGQTRPLFVYFHPLYNTMTNAVQYLIINEKSRDDEHNI